MKPNHNVWRRNAILIVMAYRDLREFIRALEQKNELKRIPFEVDPILEITEFADRAVKQGGPALLFEQPKGYGVPVLINAFASMRKMEIALEVDSVEEVARRIVEFLEMRMPEGLMGKLKMLPKLAEMGAFFPEGRGQGRVPGGGAARRVLAARLSRAAMLARRRRPLHHAAAGLLAQSRYRQAQLRHVPHAGVRRAHRRDALADAQTGRRALPPLPDITGRTRMDVAVAIGADPATMYSAILPLPPDLDEMMIAGFLRQSPAIRQLSTANLQPGDVLFFGDKGPRSTPDEIDHTGLYLGGGWFIQSSDDGVTVLPFQGWYAGSFAWARRPLREAGLE